MSFGKSSFDNTISPCDAALGKKDRDQLRPTITQKTKLWRVNIKQDKGEINKVKYNDLNIVQPVMPEELVLLVPQNKYKAYCGKKGMAPLIITNNSSKVCGTSMPQQAVTRRMQIQRRSGLQFLVFSSPRCLNRSWWSARKFSCAYMDFWPLQISWGKQIKHDPC